MNNENYPARNKSRNADILRRVDGGATFAAIAAAMGITKSLVAGVTHRRAAKVNARSDADLARCGVDHLEGLSSEDRALARDLEAMALRDAA
jgi:DNA-binding NarL/FixJ family response regulator